MTGVNRRGCSHLRRINLICPANGPHSDMSCIFGVVQTFQDFQNSTTDRPYSARTACTDRTSFHQRAMSGYPYGGGYAAQHQQPRGAPERGGWQQPAYGAVQQPAYGAVQQTAQITQQQNSTSKYSAPPGWTVHESQGHPYWANTTTGPSDA